MQFYLKFNRASSKGNKRRIRAVGMAMNAMDLAIASNDQNQTKTRVLPVNISRLGRFHFKNPHGSFLEDWDIELENSGPDAAHLIEAAQKLRNYDIPVAFPTETVYGLGADATRSSAVRGIYKAKQRPADNPLIVHVCSLNQLRDLLEPHNESRSASLELDKSFGHDPIPDVYRTLIQRFWPGPLTILLRNPPNSPLAPEVTADLTTFGARMPASLLALALIKVAGTPLAAPSANASTKPSPTTSEHVRHDLDGRIELILDGGPCEVGVESTVVDGFSDPPSILRPGGVSIDQLRQCKGWEKVVVGYKDGSERDKTPRAPGMKYRHYSPKAKVVLLEAGAGHGRLERNVLLDCTKSGARSVGILRTRQWKANQLEKIFPNGVDPKCIADEDDAPQTHEIQAVDNADEAVAITRSQSLLRSLRSVSVPNARHLCNKSLLPGMEAIEVWDIGLGGNTAEIARGLFSGLRELDQKGVDVIFVEGIEESEGAEAAAVMNRLRKAAEVEIKS